MRVPTQIKAGRFLFSQDEQYVGNLIAVTKRSIENLNQNIWLLRLEFEIYILEEEATRNTIVPTGGVASRDVVITKDAGSDEQLRKYAALLRISNPNNPKLWYKPEGDASSKDARKQRWIRIRFGPPDQDLRQPFEWIGPFDANAKVHIEHGSANAKVRQIYWRPSQVCQLLKNRRNQTPHEDTVKRFVEEREPTYGEKLVRHSEGGHWEINWYLCWHLWEADKAR
jgi:hypothetical protein